MLFLPSKQHMPKIEFLAEKITVQNTYSGVSSATYLIIINNYSVALTQPKIGSVLFG